MGKLGLLFFVILVGCSTVESLRAKSPSFTKESDVHQDDFSSCVAQSMAAHIDGSYLNYLPGPQKSSIIFQIEHYAIWEADFLKRGSGSLVEIRAIDGLWGVSPGDSHYKVYKDLEQSIDKCS